LAGTPDFIALLSDADSLQLMLFACPDGVIATDPEDDILLYTGASELMFGFAPIEVMRRPVRSLFATKDGYEHFRGQLERESRVVDLEVLASRKDGPPFIAAFSAALLRDRYGNETGSIIYVRDHSKMRAIEGALRDNNRRLNDLVRTLNHVAQHDQLTGILYRGSAIEAAEGALLASGLDGAPFGVVLFDLDQFKGVNDSYGHLVGDEVLISLAQVLKDSVRQDDIVGRFGGEEFIVFLPNASLESVTAFAERVRVAIAETEVQVGGEMTIKVTISAGVAAVPTCADSLQEAIRVADDRLLLAKRHGRNMVVADDHLQERTAA
jgi:diguanylate cyclase (GGDEF)-like protein/PAS domain S-box-containing protein